MNIRKILPFAVLAIVIFMVACTNTKKEDASVSTIPNQDTIGLAEYQRWKMENEIKEQIQNEKDQQAAAVTAAPASRKSTSTARTSSSRSSSGSGTYSSGSSSSGSSNSGTVAQPQQQQRKGMSHTAKGAIVGAASGAVIGAVANKKDRLGGGVVGGVIGAATGAGVGAIVDKKERQRGY